MLWLSIVDVIAILCNSIFFGFFLIEGAVFCSRPWLTWIVGCVGLGMFNFLLYSRKHMAS